MGRRNRMALATLLLCSARIAGAQGGATAFAPDRIADHRLADAAVAVVDAARSVIYYNPEILARVGPAVARFILAHEEAHVLLGHVRLSDGVVDAARLRGLELDADCEAARAISGTSQSVVLEAARFFAAQGASRMDELHPSGAERSERILACGLPTGRNGPSGPRPARVDAIAPLAPAPN